MNARRSRSVGARLAITLVVALSPALVPLLDASAEVAQVYTFTGSVSSSGTKWVPYPFPVTTAATITGQLDWTGANVNLNLFLKDPSGAIVASDLSATANPASVGYTASVLGTWSIGVKAKSGAASYTATVTVTPGAPSPSPSPSPSPPPPPPPPGDDSYGGGVPVWDAGFMQDGVWGANYDIGLAAAEQRARDFDMIAAPWREYADYVAAMKAVNPNLQLFVYQQGLYPSSNPTAWPETWYARDASGNKIRDMAFNTYLMDPRSQGWRDQLTSTCLSLLASSGYDGCFLDSLGASALNLSSVTGIPIDPTTGQAYTKESWYAASSALADLVRVAAAPHPVIGNGLNTGAVYFPSGGGSETILDGLDAGMSEAFARSAKWSVTTYRNETQWKQDVDMLVDAAGRPDGNVVLAVTKVWTTATAAQADAWHKYSLATFLLGYVPGHAYFTFRTDKNMTLASDYWDIEIGDPLGSYAKVDGVYQRDFAEGRVLVNPTTSTLTIDLGAAYRTPAGVIVTSITLPAHSGEILSLVPPA